MRRRIEIILLLAGLTGIGIWIWSNVRLSLFQKEANRALEHKLTERPSPMPPPRARLETGALVGRLEIPRLSLKAVVREGSGERTLDVSLGHIPGTALPGQPGNVGIAGHRDTLFRGLRHIQKNDVIQLQTTAGDYRYQVEDTSIVKPKDIQVLDAGPHAELTLVTCYPFYYVGPAPDRFIVKARLLPAAQVAAPARAVPAAAARVPVQLAQARKPAAPVRSAGKPAIRRVTFRVNQRHSSEVAPGILMGLSWTDPSRRRANGWLWVGPERRTIWLRDQAVNQPIVFRNYSDGMQRKLVITTVSRDSVAGYLQHVQ